MQESEKWKWSHSVMSNSLRPHGLQPTRLLCPWDSPAKSTGVGCQCLLWVLILPSLNSEALNLPQLYSEQVLLGPSHPFTYGLKLDLSVPCIPWVPGLTPVISAFPLEYLLPANAGLDIQFIWHGTHPTGFFVVFYVLIFPNRLSNLEGACLFLH